MRLQGFVQKDLKYHSVNVFLAVQGLRNYQKGRVPPRSSVTTTQSHPKWGHLLSSTEILAGTLPMAGCFCHQVFPGVRLSPWPFLKGNTHLQFLSYRNCKISYSACAKHPTAPRAVGDRDEGCELAHLGEWCFLGTHSEEMLSEQQGDGDSCTSAREATAEALLWVWGRASLDRKASARIGDFLVSTKSTRACGWLSLLIRDFPVQHLQDSLLLAVDQTRSFMNKL